MKRSSKHVVLALVIITGACGDKTVDETQTAEDSAETPAANFARFDWFDYAGNDPALDTEAGSDQFLNPILAGFYPDPGATRAGKDFYIVNSTFSYFPGIPVFHSTDLVNWSQVGNVIDRPGMLDFDGLGISRGVFAPTIEHHDGMLTAIRY